MVLGKWQSALARAEEAEPTEAQVLIVMVLLAVVVGKVVAMAAAVVEAVVSIGAVVAMAVVVTAGEMRQMMPWMRRRAQEKMQVIVMRSGRLPT